MTSNIPPLPRPLRRLFPALALLGLGTLAALAVPRPAAAQS